MAWVADAALLGQVVQMLTFASKGDTASQAAANAALERHQVNPQFSAYLSYVVAHGAGQADDMRMLAGLVLKRSLEANEGRLAVESGEAGAKIRKDLLTALGYAPLRKVVANCIATVIRSGGYARWPALPGILAQALQSGNTDFVAPALATCALLAADLNDVDEDIQGDNTDPISAACALVIPCIIPHMTHSSPPLRSVACKAVRQYLAYAPTAAYEGEAERILAAAAALTSDTNEDVLTSVIEIMYWLCEVAPTTVWPHMHAVLSFTVAMLRHESEAVSTAACRFWTDCCLTFVNHADVNTREFCEKFAPFVPSAVPALMDRMRMSPEDLADAGWARGNDAQVPDTEDQVRPYIRKSRMVAESGADDEEEGEGEGEAGDQSDAHAEVSTWTLRKQAAAAVEAIGDSLPAETVMPTILAELQRRLAPSEAGGPSGHDAWLIREAAVYTLGASSSCADGTLGIHTHLPTLMPFLLSLTADPMVPLRNISLWSISRFSGWVLEVHTSGGSIGGVPALSAVLQAVLRCMVDSSKTVQRKAVTVLHTLVDATVDLLAEFSAEVWAACIACLGGYQLRNRICLYDCIGALADAGVLDGELGDAHASQALMSPLLNRWAAMKDRYDDIELIPLLDTLAKALQRSSPASQAAAPHLTRQMLDMMSHNLVLIIANEEHGVRVPTELLEVALDVLAALVTCLGGVMLELLTGSNVVEYVLEACKLRVPSARQAAFALLGDLAAHCWPLLDPNLEKVLDTIVAGLRVIGGSGEARSATNNAVWAAGIIVKSAGAASVRPFLPMMVPAFAQIFMSKSPNKNLLGNTACTMGRVSMLEPRAVAFCPAPPLSEFVQPWAMACTLSEEPEERADAFRGLLLALGTNPSAPLADTSMATFVHVVIAVVHLKPSESRGDDVCALAGQVMAGYKGGMPPGAWAALWARWNEATRGELVALGVTGP